MKIQHPIKGKIIISQGFGENPDIYQRFGLPGHNGIDYACRVGTAVLACFDGEVVRVEKHPSYGNIVKIMHKGGYFSLYAHLEEQKVKIGDKVKKGDVVALSGTTGFSTGPHLHFGLQSATEGKKNYLYYVDPAGYVE